MVSYGLFNEALASLALVLPFALFILLPFLPRNRLDCLSLSSEIRNQKSEILDRNHHSGHSSGATVLSTESTAYSKVTVDDEY